MSISVNWRSRIVVGRLMDDFSNGQLTDMLGKVFENIETK
jgi:hypothetical protein